MIGTIPAFQDPDTRESLGVALDVPLHVFDYNPKNQMWGRVETSEGEEIAREVYLDPGVVVLDSLSALVEFANVLGLPPVYTNLRWAYRIRNMMTHQPLDPVTMQRVIHEMDCALRLADIHDVFVLEIHPDARWSKVAHWRKQIRENPTFVGVKIAMDEGMWTSDKQSSSHIADIAACQAWLDTHFDNPFLPSYEGK